MANDARKVSLAVRQRFTTMRDKSGRERPVIGLRILFPESAPVADADGAVWFKVTAIVGGKTREYNNNFGMKVGWLEHRLEWHVLFVSEEMQGDMSLQVTWKDNAGNSYVSESKLQPGTPVNQRNTLAVSPSTPSLRSLLFGPLLPSELARKAKTQKPASDVDAVIDILRHVHGRMLAGLGEIWAGAGFSACKGGKALCDWDPDELDGAELQEAWAQAISEQIVGTAYNGAGNFLGAWSYNSPGDGNHDRDAGFLMSIRSRLVSPAGELCVPLVFACQQLSTWVLFTAGHQKLAEDPIAATIGNKGNIDGDTVKLSGPPKLDDLKKAKGLLPGTFIFRHPSPTPHVGIIVRTPGLEAFQLLDTGGWNSGPAEGSGNHDTSSLTKLPNESNGFVIPKKALPNDLKDVIRRLRRARPLGVAQLAIFRRGLENDAKKGLVWTSGFVPLHEILLPNSSPLAQVDQIRPPENELVRHQVGYPISKLIASLRACPHSETYSIHWYVWSPLHGGDSVRGAEKTNNLAYVIRNGLWTTPDSGWKKFWWNERSTDLVTPTNNVPPEAEGPPYGPRPIGRAPIIHLTVDGSGTPTVVRIANQFRPLELNYGINIAQLREHNATQTPPPAHQAFVDLTARLDGVPVYFGGKLGLDQERPTPSDTSHPSPESDWFATDAWEILPDLPEWR